jgi:hypothetical protein
MIGLPTTWTPEQRWPPRCCVPAFLFAALSTRKIVIREPQLLARALGVKVAKGDANPLDLPIAQPSEPSGVSSSHAAQTISNFLRDMNSPIRFRHIKLNEITFGLYEDVLGEALKRGVAAGIGVDCANLYADQAMETSLHVFRVVRLKANEITLVDDSHETRPSEFTLPWIRAERASLAASDGFWLVGNFNDLVLPHTLPFA